MIVGIIIIVILVVSFLFLAWKIRDVEDYPHNYYE